MLQLSLPAWLNRGPRHKNIVVRKGSRVGSPADLKGGRVGSLGYSSTTNIWARQLLTDEYGVRPQDVTWLINRGLKTCTLDTGT